jgi:hypothetical protein
MRSLVEHLRHFWAEVRRRNVVSVAAAYLVAAWGASVGAAELLPAFGAPEWAVRAFIISAALGFPLAVVLAWVFEITPKGVVRDEGSTRRRLPAEADQTRTQVAGAGLLRVSWQDAGGTHSREFDRGFLIGRDPACGLWLDDPKVSRQHARLRLEAGVWLLEDLGSRNGTLVDGKRVERIALPHRAHVRLYAMGPVLRFEQAAAGATTVRAVASGDDTRLSE